MQFYNKRNLSVKAGQEISHCKFGMLLYKWGMRRIAILSVGLWSFIFGLSSFILHPSSSPAWAGSGNFTIGVGPIGNLFIVDSRPELDPGIGGHVYFDYRWSPQLSTTVGVHVTSQDGTGPDRGDKDIIFFGIPSFDIKYYFISRTSRWDPYALTGVGFYALSDGSRNNGSTAMGIGADLGFGCDYYLNDTWTVGFGAIYRSIGLLESFGGPGTAEFPLSLTGQLAYHF